MKILFLSPGGFTCDEQTLTCKGENLSHQVMRMV